MPCLLLTFGVVWIGLEKPRAAKVEWSCAVLLAAVWPVLAFLFLGLAA